MKKHALFKIQNKYNMAGANMGKREEYCYLWLEIWQGSHIEGDLQATLKSFSFIL